MAKKLLALLLLKAVRAQDCSGEGTTWGPGIGPPPDGCGPPTGGPTDGGPTDGGTSSGCNNPSCSSPPCAAPLLGDVGCSTVAGTESYNHEMVQKGDSIPTDAHIFGPFEAGFGEQQKGIIESWGCSDASVVYDSEGGKDLNIAEASVAKACSIQLPRIVGETYYGIVGPCGGHTGDYHFHRGFGCLYQESGSHSTKVGVVAGYNLYGKWEDYANNQLPLLDACGAHFGPTPESSSNVYHYHVQDQAPFTVGCYGPSASNGLVSVAECRALYPKCDNDGGAGTAIETHAGTVTYDKFCPCWDGAGSNMGTNIVELPALSTSAISYTAGSGSSSASTTSTSTAATGTGVSTTSTVASTSTTAGQGPTTTTTWTAISSASTARMSKLFSLTAAVFTLLVR
ncbi:unnamed protein product [Effrenium voratum]|uniref:YHYH domain-containing protein n=1 Tax=Effrenium voratum TaxID=2562239 RepID=A0AA36HVV7_9DINO|nr:unnamed protein product [Effrenium voratum]